MAEVVTKEVADEIGASDVVPDADIARISLVGAGMKTHPGVAATMFEVLADEGVNIEMISTSSIRISCVVRAGDVERGVRALHKAFELQDPPGSSTARSVPVDLRTWGHERRCRRGDRAGRRRHAQPAGRAAVPGRPVAPVRLAPARRAGRCRGPVAR